MKDREGSFFTRLLQKEGTKTGLTSVWCALAGIIIGFLILLCINPANACAGIVTTLKNFFVFSDPTTIMKYFGQTLAKAAPLVVMSLSIIFSYKAGLFNIGASGQYSIAVIFVTFGGLAWNLPWWVTIILAMLGGAAWAAISGLLRALFNVNEVISGIMLNWIALYLTNAVLTSNPTVWDASHSMAYKISPGSSSFLPNIGLDEVFGGNPIVGIGLIIAVVVAVIVFIVVKRTTFGYQIRATGLNAHASRYAGINRKRNVVITMAISGALAGLGASLNLQNGFTSWQLSSTVISTGFDAISAAFLGGLNPLGCILSSYFITHIIDGGSMITDLGYAPQIANIMTAVIIYLSGFVAFIKEYITKHDLKVIKKFSGDENSSDVKEERGNKV